MMAQRGQNDRCFYQTKKEMNPLFEITHHVAVVDAAEFVARYRDVPRFMSYCKQCGSYGKVWGCPPFDFDVEARTSGFRQVAIWGSTITFDEATRKGCQSDEQRRALSREALAKVWDTLLPFLYRQEREHPGSVIFTGRCRLCQPEKCSRLAGQSCRKPQLLRQSLEAVGFDVAGTARDVLGIELEWGNGNQLPSRITLVTALFSPTTLSPTLPER